MRRSLGPLLCELHAHSRWSDGELTVRQLVDLHGRNGFDVLCVTDHVVRTDDPWRAREGIRFRSVDESNYDAYLADVEREAERAWDTYGLLVIPGLELTFNDTEPVLAAHAVAVGLRDYVSVDNGIAEAIETATEAGAALVAAHPYNDEGGPDTRLTKRFARDEKLRGLAHRFELFNRLQLFGWVAEAGLPAVASGDFHRLEHLAGWKTLVPSHRTETALVDYLRSTRPVYLARFDLERTRAAA
jgi:predicted metal-dependent phosphoesterase TrpH